MRGPITTGGIEMSSLLFNERPLVLQPRLAFLLGGSDDAIVLQQVHYWTQKNINIRDGYSWVYNSMKEWHKQFYWISESSVKRIFTKLEKNGILITGNYNKAKFDKTKWYRIDYDALDEMEQRLGQIDLTSGSNRPNATGQIDPTYTIDYTETTTENNKIDRQIDSVALIKDFINFWETNIGFMAPLIQEDFLHEYEDWKNKGVEHDEIIAILKKALSGAISYNARDKKSYTLKILHDWLNNNVLSMNAIEGEEKQFKEQQEKKKQQLNNYNAPINNPRDLSNKHYGTAEEIQRQLFGDDS